MKVALVYNLRPPQAAWSTALDDTYAEWDEPETIDAVQAALAVTHNVVRIEANCTVATRLRALAPDIVFNMAEGCGGPEREARLPALCERWGLPFTGSSARTLRQCLDKGSTKAILQQYGLATPAYAVLQEGEPCPALPAFPLIVKPLYEGSSKGITQGAVVQDDAALHARVAYVFQSYRQPALVEAFLPGREFTVALLGNPPAVTVLPLVEICFHALPPGAWPMYSYEAKWLWDTPRQPCALLQCPAAVPPALAEAIAALCLRAFGVLECRDWCRIDVRLDASGQPYILEVNPLPGVHPNPAYHSCFPTAAAAAHLTYPDLINRVLAHACQRYGLR
jgi:D-alanine-D-alanine ligase